MVATFTQPNYTSQDSATYKASIDGSMSVLATISRSFAPHESSPTAMTITIDPGEILVDGVVVSKSSQTSSTITAPVSDSRIDLAVIDCYTGDLSIITGTPGASPVPPSLPIGKIPIANISVASGQTSIVNSNITDKRAFYNFSMPYQRNITTDSGDPPAITTSDFGKIFIHAHATDSKTWNLPSVDSSNIGGIIRFVKLGSGVMTIDAADSDTIDDSTGGGTIYSGSGISVITLELVSETNWVSIARVGTWTTA